MSNITVIDPNGKSLKKFFSEVDCNLLIINNVKIQ